jgi:GTP 3',8-cyclase
MAEVFYFSSANRVAQFFPRTRLNSQHRPTKVLQRASQPRYHARASTSTQFSSHSRPQESSIGDSPNISVGPRLANLKDAKPFSSFLTDNFNRQHTYLRISITERCNLRCLYCMPAEGIPLSPQSHLLTAPEISYLSSVFVSQGVTKIRLTGGEPTVHPQILPMLHDIGRLRSHGLKELCLTTNGLTLARKLDSMIEAGVTGINISLDTLDPLQFEQMTRRRGFSAVVKSIAHILALKRSGGASNLKLKINVVVIRGVNDLQILPFVEMTREKDLEVRFIEYMPFSGNRWAEQKMLGYKEMLAAIREQYTEVEKDQDHPNNTSKTFRIPRFKGKFGFITSMTDNFCGTCNRLRITSDGNLKVCLFGNAEVSLRDIIRRELNGGEPIDEEAWEAIKQIEMDNREGRLETGLAPGGRQFNLREKEQDLLEVIGMAVKRKKARHAGIGRLEHMENRPMILIGG